MSTWLNLAAIAVAGAVGSLCRYGLTMAAVAIPGGSTMWGTTVANLLGCAMVGGLTALGTPESEPGQLFMLALRVGFLGSLTTFSAFVAEGSVLAESGRWGGVSLFFFANLVLGWLMMSATSHLVTRWFQA
ncbi:MAG: CrcB family protein [Planctomycetota bacterium]